MDVKQLVRWNRPVPRYTSYPTAPYFYPLTADDGTAAFQKFDQTDKPLSLYLHIPFCKSMCLFCACSVVLNRKPERQTAYVDLLCREIVLVASHFSTRRRITQLHFGGGTPTSLTESEIEQILSTLRTFFVFDLDAELSIEIDPRTVCEEMLRFLKRVGFSRVSFGVQDLDPKVQEAVRRRQSEECTVATFEMARELFTGINLDLIYGLPFQTRASFQRTAQRIAELKPDRIALFSYAKVPQLKAHQKALPEEAEPNFEEKMEIYLDARNTFLQAGYCAIGMDHFALPSDDLVTGTIMRSFQGYAPKKAENLIGLGVTSIGMVESIYLQNVKTLEEYEREISSGHLPIFRGFVLGEEDKLRYWVIQSLMCRFEIDKMEFQQRFHHSFDLLFHPDQRKEFLEEGLIEETESFLHATDFGRVVIRRIAALFDCYLTPTELHYSKL